MNERIKEIRKYFNLSQEEFGNRLGVQKSQISRIESGQNNITEQTQKLICKEFNIDYIWLSTGAGEMFQTLDADIMTRIDAIMTGENETAKRVFSSFAKLSVEEWLVIEKLIDSLTEK